MVAQQSIFISHTQEDEGYANELAQFLSERGFRVWYNQQLQPGDNWAKEMARALDQSEVMVVLLSPASVKSEWVKRDIEYALTNPRFQNRLFPVVVKPTPDGKIPWILKHSRFLRERDPDEAGRKVSKALTVGATEVSEQAAPKNQGVLVSRKSRPKLRHESGESPSKARHFNVVQRDSHRRRAAMAR